MSEPKRLGLLVHGYLRQKIGNNVSKLECSNVVVMLILCFYTIYFNTDDSIFDREYQTKNTLNIIYGYIRQNIKLPPPNLIYNKIMQFYDD